MGVLEEKAAGERTPGDRRGPQPPHLPPTIGFFDDFDVLDNGRVVLANGSDFLNLSAIMHLPQMPPGSLIFVSNNDEEPRVFKDTRLFHPSSVKVVDRESKVFAKDDVIVTDKGEYGEYAASIFRPGAECQWWFK